MEAECEYIKNQSNVAQKWSTITVKSATCLQDEVLEIVNKFTYLVFTVGGSFIKT